MKKSILPASIFAMIYLTNASEAFFFDLEEGLSPPVQEVISGPDAQDRLDLEQRKLSTAIEETTETPQDINILKEFKQDREEKPDLQLDQYPRGDWGNIEHSDGFYK